MDITCKRCRAPIAAEDVNLDRALAKCRKCNAVFGILENGGPGSGLAAQPGSRGGGVERPPVPLPARFAIESGGQDFTIRWSWFSAKVIFLAVFAAFWDSFLVFWYAMAFSGPASMGGPGLVLVLFPLIHVAVGIGLTYTAVAGFLNRTTIEALEGRLEIRHAPLPWPGNRILDVADLDQLFCEQRVHRGKHGVSYTYDVNAITREGRKMKLISGLSEAGEALFLEQEIERRLAVKDRPVAGEIPR